MLEVSGFPMPLGSNVRIRSADNDYVYGEVVGFRGHRSLVLPFDSGKPLVTGAPVEPHGASSMVPVGKRSEEHTSELQSLMRISYAVFCLKKKTTHHEHIRDNNQIRH